MSDHAHHSPTLAEPDMTSARGAGIALACLAIVLSITSYMLYNYFSREAELVKYNQVLSQTNAALQEVHAHEKEILSGYGVVDAEQGHYRVPVADGIKLFVKEARDRQAAGVPQRIQATAAADGDGSEAPAK